MKTATIVMTIFLAAALAALSGCALYPDCVLVYDLPARPTVQPAPYDEGDLLVVVSVTGGGSRAALWHAAVMKELYRQVKLPDGRSIIDEIDYISSVSGGSLSSAYWCLKKPEVDTTHPEQYDPFFDAYLADMRANIEAAMAGSPLTWYRYLLSSEDRAVVLKKTFDRLYFGNGTFAELADRQSRGVSPVLIAGGTDMNTGAKFLFTTLPRSAFELEPGRMAGRAVERLAESGISLGADVFNIITPEDVGLSVMDMKVSLAAAASSSVPLLLGPVVLRDNKESTPESDVYLHISDGGVNDNQGLFSLVQLLHKKAEREGKEFAGALVLVVDANPAVDPGRVRESARAFATVEMIERSYYICFFQGRAFTLLKVMDIMNGNPRFSNVSFVYLSPYVAGDPALSDTFTGTPTRYRIDHDQADAIERAAALAVGKVKERILEQARRIQEGH